MLDVQAAADLLWESGKQGDAYPAVLRGRLDFQTALRIQLANLRRKLTGGEKLAGWKIGLTSDAVRRQFGTELQPFGHLLAAGIRPTGSEVKIDDVRAGCALEPELCWNMRSDLQGPGVTPESARRAVGSVCPAFELNEKRSRGLHDFELTTADNLTQWGVVVGAEVAPLPEGFNGSFMEVVVRRNGKLAARSIGHEVIDDHFVSLARLANLLAQFGERIAARQRVITGSFSKHEPERGDEWEAAFSGVGSCRVRFV